MSSSLHYRMLVAVFLCVYFSLLRACAIYFFGYTKRDFSFHSFFLLLLLHRETRDTLSFVLISSFHMYMSDDNMLRISVTEITVGVEKMREYGEIFAEYVTTSEWSEERKKCQISTFSTL